MATTATEQKVLNALRYSHTEIHVAVNQIEHLEQGGSKRAAKEAMARASKAIIEAFMLLD